MATLPNEVAREAWYGDCTDEDAAWALARLNRYEPLVPLITPITVTEGNFGRVPRVYITCLHDRTISPEIQKRMYTETPCREVISMQTDHSPFLSSPEELVGHLDSLAKLSPWAN